MKRNLVGCWDIFCLKTIKQHSYGVTWACLRWSERAVDDCSRIDAITIGLVVLWSRELGLPWCPWRRRVSGCFVPSLPLLPLPAAQAGCRGSGWRHLSLRPGANSLFAFISFLFSFRAFFASLSVREAIHLHPPGWPRNTRITWHSVKNTP